MNKMIQLYLDGYKSEKIETSTGIMKYWDWLEKEKVRIKADSRRSVAIILKENKKSLWVNDVTRR